MAFTMRIFIWNGAEGPEKFHSSLIGKDLKWLVRSVFSTDLKFQDILLKIVEFQEFFRIFQE